MTTNINPSILVQRSLSPVIDQNFSLSPLIFLGRLVFLMPLPMVELSIQRSSISAWTAGEGFSSWQQYYGRLFAVFSWWTLTQEFRWEPSDSHCLLDFFATGLDHDPIDGGQVDAEQVWQLWTWQNLFWVSFLYYTLPSAPVHNIMIDQSDLNDTFPQFCKEDEAEDGAAGPLLCVEVTKIRLLFVISSCNIIFAHFAL